MALYVRITHACILIPNVKLSKEFLADILRKTELGCVRQPVFGTELNKPEIVERCVFIHYFPLYSFAVLFGIQ